MMDGNSAPEKVVEAVADQVDGESLAGQALSAGLGGKAGKALGGKAGKALGGKCLGIAGSFVGAAVGVIAASAAVSAVRRKSED